MTAKTAAQLIAEIGANLPDNTTGAITPALLRTVLLDIVSSIMPTAPVVAGNLAGFNGTTGLLQDSGSSGSGGSAITPTNVNFAMSPYVPLAADQLLAVDSSGGTVTINLATSASRNGLALEVKDATGNADANPIIVQRNGAETIDTQVNVVLDSKFVAVKFAPKVAGGYYIV